MNEGNLDFQSIHEGYRARILRYLARLVGAAEAEDLVQEVFVKVHQGLPAFRGESQLSTWIYRIATNAALDRLRAPAFRQAVQEVGADRCETASALNVWTREPELPLDQQLLTKERIECFGDYVKRLPAQYRMVLVLSELEELPNKEIARILGLNVGTVKVRLHRGRRMLLQELKSHCKAEDWL